MRPEVVVGAGAALLLGALAGVEWWSEHQWRAADVIVRPLETTDSALPEISETDAADASASPRLSR
jgi:hypothetical protein